MAGQKLNIRLSLVSDLPEIDAIYNQAIKLRATAHLHPLSNRERLDWFNQHNPQNYPVFVAETNGVIWGWLSISPYRPGRLALRHTAEISYYVHQDHFRKGIGTQLINHAIKKAPQLNIRQMFGIVMEHNIASIILLKKFGFQQWGFLPEVADFDGKRVGQYYYGLRIS